MNCKHCNSEVAEKYCPNCGRPAQLKRIDGHYIAHEIEHLLHVEKGVFFTVRALLTRPGQAIKDFLDNDRTRLVKPILYIIITSLAYSIVNHFFHFEAAANNATLPPNTAARMLAWVTGHYGYANIIMGVFIALWIKLMFRKQPYNIYEILVLLCFVMGTGMLVYIPFMVLQGIIHYNLIQLSTLASILYCAWAIGNFYGKNKWHYYLIAFVAYFLGSVSFFAGIIGLGALIDRMMGH